MAVTGPEGTESIAANRQAAALAHHPHHEHAHDHAHAAHDRRAAPLPRVLLICALLGVIGYLDFATGYETPVFALYAFPIALAVWALGGIPGSLVALASIVIWGYTDIGAGHRYSSDWLFYLAAANRLVFFFAVVLCIRYMQRFVELNERLRRAFTGDITLCSQCHKIRSQDGHWSDFETYLRENTDAHLLHKVCTDCAREQYARADASR